MLRIGSICAVTVVTCISAVFLSGCGSTIVQRPIIVQQSDPKPVPTVQADVDIQILTQDLQPFGHWVDSAEYHMCWAPNPDRVRTDWRPYMVGRWAYTDFGWTWISDEPWGHITYHYGSWIEDPIHGWIWVPGRVWSPAWVAWWSNDEYIGWAPLPPHLCMRAQRIGHLEAEAIGWRPSQFSFVHARHIMERRLQDHVRPVRENVTIIKKTFNITNINVNSDNWIVNNSISVQNVENVTYRRVRHESLMSATSSREAQRLHEQGKAVIYRPLKKPGMTQQQVARRAEQERQRQEAAKWAEQERQRQEAVKRAEQERQRQEAAKRAEQERQRQKNRQKNKR